MVNRSFLICDESATPVHDPSYPGPEARAAGTRAIPILWHALFTPDRWSARRGLDEAGSCPIAIAPTAEARALFEARRPAWLRALPEPLAVVLSELAALIAELEGAYLKLEPYEIWMTDPAGFDRYLAGMHELVALVESSPADASRALERCGVRGAPDDPAGDRNTVATLLRGGRWQRPVPWRDAEPPQPLPSLS